MMSGKPCASVDFISLDGEYVPEMIRYDFPEQGDLRPLLHHDEETDQKDCSADDSKSVERRKNGKMN